MPASGNTGFLATLLLFFYRLFAGFVGHLFPQLAFLLPLGFPLSYLLFADFVGAPSSWALYEELDSRMALNGPPSELTGH